jgi:predicted phage tail protein
MLHHDARYEAVGSSSLREELYNTFMKGKVLQSAGDQIIMDNSNQIIVENVKNAVSDPQERRNRAVKDREDKIKDERRRLEAEIARSKSGINQEEGERNFMCAIYLFDY